MTDRTTWQTCPSCGRVAAVGWVSIRRPDHQQAEVPIELDCPSGCRPTLAELRHAFPVRLLMPAGG